MSAPVSAGLLLHRQGPTGLEFLLVHPGGPYWRNKDTAAWSIPKGLVEDGEEPWTAALREFAEEIGRTIDGPATALRPCRTSGKTIHAWLVDADLDVETVRSNTFELEWPPRSGRTVAFPEIDAAAWFGVDVVLAKIHRGQQPIVIEAMAILAGDAR